MGKVKLLLLGVIFFLSFWFLKVFIQDSYPDFRVYYEAASSVMVSIDPYASKDPAMAYLYPPITLLFFLPLTSVVPILAEKLWLLLSIALCILSFGFLYKLLRISWKSLEGMVYFMLILLFFPLKFTLGMGQINILVLFFIVLFFYFYEKKKVLSGVFLSFAIATKLSPVLFLFYLLYKREWDIVYTVIISLLGLGVISLIFFPGATETYVFTILPNTAQGWPTAYYNQALTGFLGRLSLPMNILSFLRLLIASTIIGVTCWSFVKAQLKDVYLVELSSILPLILLLSSFSWQHHFVLLIPSFIIASHFLLHRKKKENTLIFLLLLSYVLVGYNIKSPENVSVILQSHVFYGTLLIWGIHMYVLQKE